MMKVIAEKQGAWILCCKDQQYFLSVMVQVTGAAWDMQFQLNEAEVKRYRAAGNGAIDSIDEQCQRNVRAYSERTLGASFTAEMHEAILAYRKQSKSRIGEADPFEGMTPNAIISFLQGLDKGYFRSKMPDELFRSKYLYGQTVILQGRKGKYRSPTEFWLACQAWCSEDEIVFDDITAYTSWWDDENRIGVCHPLDAGKRDQIDERLRAFGLGIDPQGYLLMDPSWNNEKILFADDEHYYLYYWWTGE
ncbi:MAG: hypothetical protein AAF485_29960 [Chloroflexota bacterium]